MTFDTVERSVSDGQPVELYEFVGTNQTYRYTSYPTDVLSNGNTFVALEGLKRTRAKAGTQDLDNAALDITLPFNTAMVSAYVFAVAPPQLSFSLYRAHRDNFNDTLLMWKGEVTSWSVQGREVRFRVPTLFGYILGNECPPVKYQGPCNHVLYDEFCKVDSSALDPDDGVTPLYESTRTVSTINETTVVLDSSPFADDACNGGEMVFTAGGERRLIIDNVGTSFTINYPFATLAATDTVIIRQGCDHSFATCKSKFNNGINFGGFPYVPDYNPFSKQRL